MKTMKIRRLAFAMLAAMLSLASCSSDDDYKFDASKLEGKWRKAIRSGIMAIPRTGILVASSSKFLHGPMKVGKQLTSIIGLERQGT